MICVPLQDLLNCPETNRTTYCQLYIAGHCSVALHKAYIWKTGDEPSKDAEFKMVCDKFTLDAKTDDAIRRNISEIHPIYLQTQIIPSSDRSDDYMAGQLFYKR